MHHLSHDTHRKPRRIVTAAGKVEYPFILAHIRVHTTHDTSLLSVKFHNSESVRPYRANITVIILLRTASLSFSFEFLPNLNQIKKQSESFEV